jgi:hypothetical protein
MRAHTIEAITVPLTHHPPIRTHGIRNEITSRNENEKKKHNIVIYDNM